MKTRIITNLFTFFLWGFLSLNAQQLAFPGAEGFGATSTGGRNGSVYHVVTLNDSGPGSFRDAVSQPNRTVVFDVAGVIKISSRVSVASQITIAGQTAPGEGITIYGTSVSFSGSNNVIVRYIRFHGSINMPRGGCVVIIDNADNVILDHCSITWGRWDNLHIKDSKNVTVQYCIDGEAIDPQRFGALLENPTNLTIHHCLWIDNQSRNPKAKAGIQFVNNVVYNWGGNGLVGGHSAALHYQDLIGNYFIAGPSSDSSFIGMFTATDNVYHRGNFVDYSKDGILNGIPVTDQNFTKAKATLSPNPQNISQVPVKDESAEKAFRKVLESAGASIVRDTVDKRMISQLASLGKKGQIIRTEAAVGGQSDLKSGKTKKDTDGDGMPDEWEVAHKLNPKNPEDRNDHLGKDGYTNLEDYLNSLTGKE
ncbi:MAG TPA: pectate lyase [Bacteroidales bacterium]